MNKSAHKNIYHKIQRIMSEIDYIQKGDKRVNNQYRYVSHDQVTGAIHPQLVKHGVVIVPTIETSVQNGNRTEVMLSVTFVNVDDPKDQFTIKIMGYGIGNDDKGPGKAVSYAYKYALLKVFCLETGDDPDHDQKSEYDATDPQSPYINEKQFNALMGLLNGHVELKDKILRAYEIESLKELSKQEFAKCQAGIKKRLAEMEK